VSAQVDLVDAAVFDGSAFALLSSTFGIVNQKVLPVPTSLMMPILPPWRSTMSLQIANPKPNPD
jgi:hypothetical protein